MEEQVWAAAYGAAWVASFNHELAERHKRPNIDGSFNETMEQDHAEEATTLADAAVEQLRDWKRQG